MKEFMSVTFDPQQCQKEINSLQSLLTSKRELSERDEILPFFKSNPQLSAFIGTYFSNIGPANLLAYEFEIFGDFAADILIGNRERGVFCAVELEDARSSSIFSKVAGKATKEWGRRFEHGFGQLVDWFYSWDDHKNSAGFTKQFGYGHIDFFGLLLIGRSEELSDHDRARLKWRSDRVSINTQKVFCHWRGRSRLRNKDRYRCTRHRPFTDRFMISK